MGNAGSKKNGGGNDEENALATSVAEAAAEGARKAVLDEVQKARLGGVEGGQQIVPHGDLIAGVLSIEAAQEAAAAGAKKAVDDLNIAIRCASDLNKLKDAAGSGAKAAVKALSLMVAQADVEGQATAEIAAAAAGAGAWVACFVSVQTCFDPTPNASKYTSLLGPMLGGSMPTSAAIYSLSSTSSDFVKLLAFGGITMGVFVMSSGLIAGLLGTTPGSLRCTRIAAAAALVILWMFFTVVLCTLFDSATYRTACGATCCILILILVCACRRFVL